MITLLFQYFTSLSSVATVQHHQHMEFTFHSVLMSSTVIFKTEEEFEDTKGVIKIRKSKKDRQHNGQRKGTEGRTKIYKTLHIKLKIE